MYIDVVEQSSPTLRQLFFKNEILDPLKMAYHFHTLAHPCQYLAVIIP
jgi:hypothetical protein